IDPVERDGHGVAGLSFDVKLPLLTARVWGADVAGEPGLTLAPFRAAEIDGDVGCHGGRLSEIEAIHTGHRIGCHADDIVPVYGSAASSLDADRPIEVDRRGRTRLPRPGGSDALHFRSRLFCVSVRTRVNLEGVDRRGSAEQCISDARLQNRHPITDRIVPETFERPQFQPLAASKTKVRDRDGMMEGVANQIPGWMKRDSEGIRRIHCNPWPRRHFREELARYHPEPSARLDGTRIRMLPRTLVEAEFEEPPHVRVVVAELIPENCLRIGVVQEQGYVDDAISRLI